MAFRVISVGLEANDARLTSGMRRASASVDEFGRRTTTAARTSTRASNEMTGSFSKLENVLSRGVTRSMVGFTAAAFGGYQAGRALNAAIQAVVGGAVQLDARMRNVNSISKLSEQQLAGLTGQVVGLSRVLPQSANTLAEGLYDIASSGFQGADGLTVLTASARAASAGLTTTGTSAAAIAGVLNAYGDGANHAKYVSDALFKTVDVGVLSFGDLAQGIGQVIGTAAAANVSVDELGQAIATMTKGGIIPAEAFTSANQLLAQIIQPGEALTALFHQLGYESGAAALQSKGLAGVMQDIQHATGGNVTAMSSLFTDIRSLRGALALTSDQGKLYRGVIASWAGAHEGAGATATALAEQMKSVAAQWQLFKNRVQAAAIETGTRLLPALLATMHGADAFGDTVGDVVGKLSPTFHNIAEAGISAAHVIGILATAAEPLVRVLATIVGVPVVATLEAISKATAAVIGFFEKHRTTTVVLASVIATMLLPSLAQTAAAMSRLAGLAVLNALLGLSRAAGLAAGGLAAVRAGLAGMLSLSNVASAGLGVAMVVGIVGMYRLQQATAAANREVAGMTKGFNALDSGAAQHTLEALRAKMAETLEVGKDYNGVWGTFKAGWDTVFGGGDAARAGAEGKAASDAYADLAQQLQNVQDNAARLAAEMGISSDAVIAFAKEHNIDISLPWENAGDAVEDVRVGLQTLAGQAGTTVPALTQMTEGSVEAMQALAESIKAAGDATRTTFAGATDVIQQFDPEGAAGEVQAAQDKMLDAQRRLRQEQAQYNAEKDHSVSSSQQLADAHREVAEAADELSKAQSSAAESSDLSTIYRRNIDMARSFVDNIDEALQRGLDPQMVMRLLQAGPQQAGPLLDALVESHSDRLIRLANTSEHALSRISERAIRIAQFTARAVNAPLEDQERLARELPKAFALDDLVKNMPAPANGAWLAEKLGMTPAQVRRIAKDFGITLSEYVQQTLNGNPVHLRVEGPHSPGTVKGNVYVPRGADVTAAEGGHITGPGTATSDSILARLSNGEYVMRAAAVAYYGVSTMAALNKMSMPRYADGGMVGQQGTYGGGAPRVVVVKVDGGAPSHSTTWQIGQVVAHDYADFRRQTARQERARRAVER